VIMVKFVCKFCVLSALFLLLSCTNKASVYDSTYAAAGFGANESPSRSSEAQEDRLITYNASIDLLVKNTEETKTKLAQQVKNNGGYIVRETDNSVNTRIPAENMDVFINFARTLGEIENETKTGTDITDQYRDNLLRLESLKNVRNRYMELLRQANAVSDILSIEKELERVNLEIERLEGRINHAEQSAAYSSITVRFREKAKPGPLGWIFYGLYRGFRWLFVWD